MNRTIGLCFGLFAAVLSVTAQENPPMPDAPTGIRAIHRAGQTFIMWNEGANGPAGKYVVYRSGEPITARSVGAARVLYDRHPAGSADDYNVEWMRRRRPTANLPERGLVIEPGGQPLTIKSGLYVHKVEQGGPHFYAVTVAGPDGKPVMQFDAGRNSLTEPVKETPAEMQPVPLQSADWRKDLPKQGCSLKVVLHPKSIPGYPGGYEFFHYTDGTLTHREGYAYWFCVVRSGTAVELYLSDVNPFIEKAQHNTWWYGYRRNLVDEREKAVVENFTERRALWTIAWVMKEFNVDPRQVYLSGSSMGGSGAVAFGLRHPELFATIDAFVPIVDYSDKRTGYTGDFQYLWGTFDENLPTNEGTRVYERQNAIRYVLNHPGETPFLRIDIGKNDAGMCWPQKLPFLEALQKTQRGFLAGWHDLGHSGGSSRYSPRISAFPLTSLRLDTSYPALGRASNNSNPGNGDPADGDWVGGMNVGLTWTIEEDSHARWAVVLKADADRYPVTVDITPRRLQQFRIAPGQRCRYTLEDVTKKNAKLGEGTVEADARGVVTVVQAPVTGSGGVRLVLTAADTTGASTPEIAKRVKVFVLSGQSNSLGTTADPGEKDISPGENALDAKVPFFWSNRSTRAGDGPAQLYGDSGGRIVGLRAQQGEGTSPQFWGPEIAFGRRLASAGVTDILIVKASRGGGGNRFWLKGSGDDHMYRHIVETVGQSVAALPKGTEFEIAALLYVQGESDTEAEAQAAGERLRLLAENLRKDLPHAGGMGVLVGGIAAAGVNRDIVRAQQSALAKTDATFRYIDTLDLRPQLYDKLHFNKAAKLDLGVRMADAWLAWDKTKQP